MCEGKTMNLACPSGNIFIEKATFGRTEKEVCKHDKIKTTNCTSTTSEAIVKKNCDGKPQCSIAVNTTVFGDPCQGTHKYLEVNFICY